MIRRHKKQIKQKHEKTKFLSKLIGCVHFHYFVCGVLFSENSKKKFSITPASLSPILKNTKMAF